MRRLIDKDDVIRGFKNDFPVDVTLNITTICNYIERAEEVVDTSEEDFEDEF